MMLCAGGGTGSFAREHAPTATRMINAATADRCPHDRLIADLRWQDSVNRRSGISDSSMADKSLGTAAAPLASSIANQQPPFTTVPRGAGCHPMIRPPARG